jgi:hypothetical protein
MAGLAELDVGCAGDRRSWRDQVLGIEQPGTGLALVATGGGAAAVGAGACDVAVGQEAAVGRRICLADRALLDEARLVER